MVKYPNYRDELLALVAADQKEIREYSRAFKQSPDSPHLERLRKKLTKRNVERGRRVIEILEYIKEPTIANIGKDGLKAMSVIILHSKYTFLKRVLEAFEVSYKKDPHSMDASLIPAMVDRVRMLEHKKQKFGTQWLAKANGKPFLYPVENFQKMNNRRAAYGLGKARRPRDLTYGIPASPPPPYAKESDQYQPSKEELDYYMSELYD